MKRLLPAGARWPDHKGFPLRKPFLERRSRRGGMTLLEVIFALAIFLLSLVAIGRLVHLSSDQAREILLRGQAMDLCQSKMAEIYVGAESLTSQSDVPFPEDSTWHWSADCNQAQVTNLWTVQVKVSKDRGDGSNIEVTLTQMMLDPSVQGTSVNLNTSGSSSSNSSSSSTGGS
jgi:type II secretion system protein I